MQKTEKKEPLRILIVGGHPADVFDNAGGTLLHHIQRGDSVTALTVTHGARVHDAVMSEEMHQKKVMPDKEKLDSMIKARSDVKESEVKEACALFGIHDVRFLFCDDSVMLVKEKIIIDIARLIRELRPDVVITHYPYDHGGIADQHAVTAQIVLNAVRVAAGVEPGDSNPPHRVAQVFFMGNPSLFFKNNSLVREFSPYCDVYVDISDVIHLKIKALDKLKSQQYNGAYARKRVETSDGIAGVAVGLAYAEPFISYYPEVYHTLFVSDFLRQRAREPESAWFKRVGFLVTKSEI